MSDTSVVRDFFLGFIRIHVLHHAAEEPIYGLGMIEELSRHGYELSPGTLYPLLHRMHADGYLEREERLDGGKIRKYYTITSSGREVLAEARRKIAELTGEVTDRGR
jgi:DNA-binding PadR family transcriptional regulator